MAVFPLALILIACGGVVLLGAVVLFTAALYYTLGTREREISPEIVDDPSNP